MENREQQILSEIKSLISQIRDNMDAVEKKLSQLQQEYESQEVTVPIDLDMDDVFPEPVAPVELPVAEPVAEQEPAVAAEPEPVLVAEPEPVVAAPVKERPKAVIDVMTSRQAWRNDMPGAHVNDIRSAIALNDRILFINMLFNEDPMAFQNAVAKINGMETLDQVVDYLFSEFPDWDFESEVVYRFMMAVRRRVR